MRREGGWEKNQSRAGKRRERGGEGRGEICRALRVQRMGMEI
jgi:hypothetical protein